MLSGLILTTGSILTRLKKQTLLCKFKLDQDPGPDMVSLMDDSDHEWILTDKQVQLPTLLATHATFYIALSNTFMIRNSFTMVQY